MRMFSSRTDTGREATVKNLRGDDVVTIDNVDNGRITRATGPRGAKIQITDSVDGGRIVRTRTDEL